MLESLKLGLYQTFILDDNYQYFIKGLGTTLTVTIFALVLGVILGVIVAVIRSAYDQQPEKKKGLPLKILNGICKVYLTVIRGTPMMVQAIVLYFGMQEFMGVDFKPTVAGIIIVSINTGAYMVEVVRGGIQSVDPGQMEAAKSIGMTHGQAMINIILPQTIRNILPATGNEFIINIKDTSVLNVISVTELFFVTKSIKGAIFRTYETFIVAAIIYFLLTLTVTRLLKLLEKRMDGPQEFIPTSSTMPIVFMKKSGDK